MESKTLSQIKEAIAIIKQAVEIMPNTPGIYKMLSGEDKILYIGKAKSLPKRVISYTKFEVLSTRIKRMVSQVIKVETISTKTEGEALLLEASLIKSLKPIYNICLRDDKSFPYIYIDESHEFPRIIKFRGKPNKQGEYFGPFASATAVNQTISELQKLFMIRPCTDSFFTSRSRPCIQYEIKRCAAPCVNKITKEDYKQLVNSAKDFLSGKSTAIQEQLIRKMEILSEKLQFEQAAFIRDRLKLLSQIQAKNAFNNSEITDADIFALYMNDNQEIALMVFIIRGGKNYGSKTYFENNKDDSESWEILESLIGQFYQRNPPSKNVITNIELHNTILMEQALQNCYGYKVTVSTPTHGKKKEMVDIVYENAQIELIKRQKSRAKNQYMMKALAKLFDINCEIKRIEIYDNSHTQGSNSVGCMVVAGPEGFNKSAYRKFNIKSTDQGDDCAMMREVFNRRLKKLDEENKPQLIIIDGGIGQLNAVMPIFEKLNVHDIPIIAMSKGKDRNAGREFFHTINREAFQLPKGDHTLLYLQSIRDEVHRFAIDTHRQKNLKMIKKSELDSIVGIGNYRKKQLLSYFGSMDGIRTASVTDLQKIGGIDKKIAQLIYDHLHGIK